MTIQDTFDNFMLSRRLADLSEKTISDYQQFITPFVAHLGLLTDFHTIEQSDINKYIEKLLKMPISKATRATYIRHVKIYLRWCEEEYGSRYNAKQIKIPKTPKKKVLIYSDEEIKDIFNSVSAESDWLIYRNKCIIALMYDSGLRQSEVCSLLRSKISFKENNMIVYGKGSKERTVPLGKLTQHFMKLYSSACPYSEDYFFVNRRGERLTCNAVKLFVTKLADSLPFELSSHKLRHNFATNYLLDQYRERGQMDVFHLMVIMGHEDIETTKKYLHYATEIIATRGAISHLDGIYSGEN